MSLLNHVGTNPFISSLTNHFDIKFEWYLTLAAFLNVFFFFPRWQPIETVSCLPYMHNYKTIFVILASPVIRYFLFCFSESCPPGYRTVFFDGVKKCVTHGDLHDKFSKYGPIEKTMTNFGQGCVVFRNEDDCDYASQNFSAYNDHMGQRSNYTPEYSLSKFEGYVLVLILSFFCIVSMNFQNVIVQM